MKAFIKTILYIPLYNALIFLVWLAPGHNVGLAIIVLTILIRLALAPSTNKTFKAQKEMKALQPKLDEIKAKYSKEEQAQKTMELYKEHKVNPLGSCLPMLIQLPIIFVLYKVFQVGLSTSHFQMLYSFMPRPETVNAMFLGINLAKPEKFILPLIVSALQLLQMWQMQKYTGPAKKPADGKQADMATMMTKQMMYLTPVMMFIISIRLPAALPLYWGVTTLFAIGQQWWFFEKKGMAVGVSEAGGSVISSTDEPRKELPASIKKESKNSFGGKFKLKKSDVVVTVRRKGER